jgi:hypothetical protein
MLRALCGALVLLPLLATTGLTETTTKDVLIVARTFSIIVDPPVGTVRLAVVYDPSVPESAADLRTIVGAIGDGINVEAMRIVGTPIQVSDLGKLANYRFVLLTGGLKGYYKAISNSIHGKGTLTISTDLECVRGGLCVMGVASQPRVQVLVNRAASEASGSAFLVSFRIMITEL